MSSFSKINFIEVYLLGYNVHILSVHFCELCQMSKPRAISWILSPSPQKRYIGVLNPSTKPVFGERVFTEVVQLKQGH